MLVQLDHLAASERSNVWFGVTPFYVLGVLLASQMASKLVR